MLLERKRTTQTDGLMVEKRDGSLDPFNSDKIYQAIAKAYHANRIQPQESVIHQIIASVVRELQVKGTMQVEEIQDLVERGLMASNPFIAKKYILYRQERNVERERRSGIKRAMDSIVNVENNDTNRSNANMSSATPSGQMMTCASEHFKEYALNHLVPKQFVAMHRDGDIHIHDLDYYPTKTSTCLQYDLESLLSQGFRTKNGSVRPPQNIQNYATLATIIFQTNQNEQHGGQSIPAFDFSMAPGVRKSYNKCLAEYLDFTFSVQDPVRHGDSDWRSLLDVVREKAIPLNPSPSNVPLLREVAESCGFSLTDAQLENVLKKSYRRTQRETHQAMEGFIHNLNTMHSRGGNQVVFSSVNYGTDTSEEGRMVISSLLQSTMEGLGNNEIPIFPIQIFKVKEGVNFSERDFRLAMENYEAATRGELEFETPNFDLLLRACHTTAHVLFPNFLFLDSTFNRDELWQSDDPRRYMHEVATMGCRTRVYENVNGPRTSVGRGNLSFTSINFPRLAIKARQEVECNNVGLDAEQIQDLASARFLEKVRAMSVQVAEQLKARYEFQSTALACQFPFMIRNDVWKGGRTLTSNSHVRSVLSQGTLGIGFIGGHNALMALYGQGHAKNRRAWQTLYDAVMVMNDVAREYKERYGLNYSVLATPAEGLSGRFTKLDQQRFGIIKGVNDRKYYVNSFHIDVREPISIQKKIELEAPFHSITLGGHITYVELDGEAAKNSKSILRILGAMYHGNIGYGAINHRIDTCEECGYKGVIYHHCPVCKGEQIKRVRRITGYLTPSTEYWGEAKLAEEADRVQHS